MTVIPLTTGANLDEDFRRIVGNATYHSPIRVAILEIMEGHWNLIDERAPPCACRRDLSAC
jgi:hypothetical protein